MKTYAVVKYKDQWGVCITGSYTMVFESYREALDTAMRAAEILRGATNRASARFMDGLAADIAKPILSATLFESQPTFFKTRTSCPPTTPKPPAHLSAASAGFF
jgi:hypothetical protein